MAFRRVFLLQVILLTVQAGCPEGFDYVRELAICLGSPDAVGQNYSSNEGWCENNGGLLAIIKDAFKNTLLASYVEKDFRSDRAMIGLHRSTVDANWLWSDGTKADYLHWAPGNPRDGDDCGFLDGNDYYWYSGSCSSDMPFLCETGPPACNRCTMDDPKLNIDLKTDGSRNFTRVLSGFEGTGCSFLLLNCTSQAIEYQATISIQYDQAGTEDGTPTALATLTCADDGQSWIFTENGVTRSIDTVGCFPIDCDMVDCSKYK